MICVNHFVLITGLELQPMIEKRLDAERVFLISTGSELVVWMLGQIVFIRQEGTNASQLKDTFAAVHNSQFITTHELLAQLLVVGSVAWTIASCIRGIEGIDGFFAECFGEFFQSRPGIPGSPCCR